MELHNNRVGDFCKRIKSQQSDLAIKIPFRREKFNFLRRSGAMKQ
jgi:hypothetical protein